MKKTSILDYPKNVLQSVFENLESFKINLNWVDGDWEIVLGHLVGKKFMHGKKVLRVLNKYTKTGLAFLLSSDHTFFKFSSYIQVLSTPLEYE